MQFLDIDPVEHLMVDGRKMDPAEPVLPAPAPGVLRGEGIFEAFLVDDKLETPFLSAHDQRLFRSAELMDMDLAGRLGTSCGRSTRSWKRWSFHGLGSTTCGTAPQAC